MNKKIFVLITMMAVIIGVSFGLTKWVSYSDSEKLDKIKVVTSFYPVYVATANVIDGMDQIELVNLTENQGGCLHDYQLTTEDMKELEDAQVFIINGGGMESFIEDIVKNYPELTIIDSSEGIDLLDSTTEHHHEEEESEETEESEEHHGEFNGHIWLNPEKYMKQVDNIQNGLSDYSQNLQKELKTNGEAYKKKIVELEHEIKLEVVNKEQKEVIIFHDAFAYLAEYLGIEIVYAVNLDDETTLSAGEIAEVIDEVNLHQIKVLFTEEQYGDTIASSIAKETDANVYVIDSLVTGKFNKDAYVNGMKHNMSVLKEALSQ